MTGAVAISRASPDHIFILEIRAAQFSYRVTPILPQHIYIYSMWTSFQLHTPRQIRVTFEFCDLQSLSVDQLHHDFSARFAAGEVGNPEICDY